MSDPAGADPYVPSCVLLTGGAGFIGSHVLERLVRRFPACQFYNLDKIDYCGTTKNLESIANAANYTFVKAWTDATQGSITSPDLVAFLLRDKKVDTIMHFAAQSHVDRSFESSFDFTHDNVLGTHVLLEGARIYGVKRFIHVSTDEVYGERHDGGAACVEESILAPTNPYSATKAAAEFMVKAYSRSFNLPIIVTRSNNVYGPRQFPEKIIPKFISQLLQDEPCWIHGDGSNKRRYLYVTDVADAFETILQFGKIGEVYNIGTDTELSNLEVARLLLRSFHAADREKDLIQYVEDRKFNDYRYFIDSAKLHALGWRPQVAFEDGLKRTIDWYRDHPEYWENSYAALRPHPVRLSGAQWFPR